MKKVIFVNHKVKNCGVYQYGKRVFDICKKSKKVNFDYIEVDSEDEFFSYVKVKIPDVLIYNYVPSTMPWINFNVLNKIKKLKIKQGNIIHNCRYGEFDFYLHQDPYYIDNQNNFSLPRPLFEYTPKNSNNRMDIDDIIKIGTFGFAGKHKFFNEICRLVSEEFTHKKIQLNFHITEGFYCGDSIDEIKNSCNIDSKFKNIELTITDNFLTDEEILNFLHNNDLNVFFYDDYSFYNGISSSIDYALSVKKPIAICKSNMFSHILDTKPSICVEEMDLYDIIKNGFVPLEKKYNSWSHEKFIHSIENIISLI
jgi:hypothetical protein